MRLVPYAPGGEILDTGVRTWPWLGLVCWDETQTRLWLETQTTVASAGGLLAPLPTGARYDITVWTDVADGSLGETVLRQVADLRVQAVGLGYVTLRGGPCRDEARTRVSGPPEGVALGNPARPSAWSAAVMGRKIDDECRSAEADRLQRRAAAKTVRDARRGARKDATRSWA